MYLKNKYVSINCINISRIFLIRNGNLKIYSDIAITLDMKQDCETFWIFYSIRCILLRIHYISKDLIRKANFNSFGSLKT